MYNNKLQVWPLKEKFFIDESIIDTSYPERDYHTMYVVKIEKIFEK